MLKRIRQRNPGMSLTRILYYEFLRNIVRIITNFFVGMRVEGQHHLPETGPIVIIANHQSFLDPPLMGAALKRHFVTLARSTLFDNLVLKMAIRSVNAIPVRGDQKDTAVFKECARHLAAGRIVLIYPEGSRTADGTVDEFKRGVMLLLRRSKAPVLPMAIEGAYDNWPRHESRPHARGPVHFKLGAPIPSEEILALDPDSALALLRDRVDSMRLELRAKIRIETNGRFPAPGPGDYHHLESKGAASVDED